MYTKNPTYVPPDLRTASSGEVDLSKAILLIADSWGVFLPQKFAETIKRDFVTGVSDEDYKVLEEGPKHEFYWEAWADVCDNAKITDEKLGECYLHQDGDLWLVPVEKEEEKPVETKHVLGHDFKPFTELDWDCFAGAEEGSYICHCADEKTILILSPDGSISEIVWNDDTENASQVDYKPSKVL